MPIFVTCQCGKKSRVPDEFAGRRVKCPACGRGIAPTDEAPVSVSPGGGGRVPPPSAGARKIRPKNLVGMTLLTLVLSIGVPVLIVGPKTKAKEFVDLIEELKPPAFAGLAGGAAALIGGLALGRLAARLNLPLLNVGGGYGMLIGIGVGGAGHYAGVDGFVVLGFLSFFLGWFWVVVGAGSRASAERESGRRGQT